MKKLRVRKLNAQNWVVEEWQKPKDAIHKSGPHKGKPTKGFWQKKGYYGYLEHTVPCLLELSLDGPFENTDEILRAIEKAKTEIIENLRQIILPEH